MFEYIRKHFLILLFVSCIFYFLGFISRNLDIIKIVYEIKITEIIGIFLTIFIGFLIPFYLKKLIDDNRTIKELLIQVCNQITNTKSSILKSIKDTPQNTSFNQECKDLILFQYTEIESLIDSLENQINISFPKSTKTIVESLRNSYFEYKSFITGGDLMNSSFKNSTHFIKECQVKTAKMEESIKIVIHKISKL